MILMGTPEETGTLVIRGCLVQITGFAEQEFLVDQEVKKSPEEGFSDTFVKIKRRYCIYLYESSEPWSNSCLYILSGLKAIKSNRKQGKDSIIK